eukprot:scaffold29011_cov38-Cyclotella_meneghiniana.AAC.2
MELNSWIPLTPLPPKKKASLIFIGFWDGEVWWGVISSTYLIRTLVTVYNSLRKKVDLKIEGVHGVDSWCSFEDGGQGAGLTLQINDGFNT